MKTPEEFLQTYASFEFDAWKKDHPDQLRILSKAMKDYAEHAVDIQRNIMANHLNIRNVRKPWTEK